MDLKQCESLLLVINELSQLSQLKSFRHQFQQAFDKTDYTQQVLASNEMINKMHDSLIQKAIQLVEQEMIGEGLGPPPSPYCYILLGSGGRQEQTLGSDQDSAIIYENEDTEDSNRLQHYFLILGDKVVKSLTTLGYAPCDGNVQSNVPMWCKSQKKWNSQVEKWIEESDWESIRYLLICADARMISGNQRLYNRIMNEFNSKLNSSKDIYQRMIDNTVHHRVMVNVFGQLLTVKYGEDYGSIDIKYGAYIPFVNAIRWLALRNQLQGSSTLQRLEKLYVNKHFSDDEYLQYRNVFIHILSLRLIAGYEEENGFFEGRNRVHPKRLEKEQVKNIKNSLRIGKKLQKHIQYFIRHSSR